MHRRVFEQILRPYLVAFDRCFKGGSRPRSFLFCRRQDEAARLETVGARFRIRHHWSDCRPMAPANQLMVVPEMECKAAALTQSQYSLLEPEQANVPFSDRYAKLARNSVTVQCLSDVAAFDRWRRGGAVQREQEEPDCRQGIQRGLAGSVARRSGVWSRQFHSIGLGLHPASLLLVRLGWVTRGSGRPGRPGP